jgi:hypothetical protein
MTVPRIPIMGLSVPAPVLLIMWVAAVGSVAMVILKEMQANAPGSYDSTAEDAAPAEVAWGGPPCLDYVFVNDYWSYRWCNERSVTQIKYGQDNKIEASNSVDIFLPHVTVRTEYKIEQWYKSEEADCMPQSANPEADTPKQRSAVVLLYCCDNRPENPEYLIANVFEPQACHYRVQVCAADLCDVLRPTDVSINGHNTGGFGSSKKRGGIRETKKISWKSADGKAEASNSNSLPANARDSRDLIVKKQSLARFSDRPVVGLGEQAELKEQTRQMFVHAYDAYMKHGFPNVSILLCLLFCLFFCFCLFLFLCLC